MSDKTYAQFNTLTITGRVFNAELVTNNGSEFLAMTLITNLMDDADGVIVTFNTSDLISLYQKGYLPNGRSVTVTGHLAKFSEIYFDKKAGKNVMLKRPKLHLVKAQVLDGGFGPLKKEEVVSSNEVVVDAPPAFENELTPEEAYAL